MLYHVSMHSTGTQAQVDNKVCLFVLNMEVIHSRVVTLLVLSGVITPSLPTTAEASLLHT